MKILHDLLNSVTEDAPIKEEYAAELEAKRLSGKKVLDELKRFAENQGK
jgi:hypothetical protein